MYMYKLITDQTRSSPNWRRPILLLAADCGDCKSYRNLAGYISHRQPKLLPQDYSFASKQCNITGCTNKLGHKSDIGSDIISKLRACLLKCNQVPEEANGIFINKQAWNFHLTLVKSYVQKRRRVMFVVLFALKLNSSFMILFCSSPSIQCLTRTYMRCLLIDRQLFEISSFVICVPQSCERTQPSVSNLTMLL